MPRALTLLTIAVAALLAGAVLLVAGLTGASASSQDARPASSQLSRLLVPPDGQVYLGMFIRPGRYDGDCSEGPYQCGARWGDSRPFAERVQDTIENELGGKKLAFLRVAAEWEWNGGTYVSAPIMFSHWLGDIAEAQSVTGPGSAVFLDWSLTTSTKENGGLTVKDVAAGTADTYIRSFAAEIRSYGKPLLIRLFGGELNGSWWWGQSPMANPSLTTTDFVRAWRRVVDIFRREGALNVSWAWNVNAVPPTPVSWEDTNIGAYWPGDDYVDWAGADIYDSLPISYLDVPYNFAVAHNKPFFLAEWGARIGGSTLTPTEQNTWLNQMFDYFETHPAIKAISYFNYNTRPDIGFPIDPARLTCLYDGKVCYQVSSNDFDHRLLADSGAGWRQTFSRRVSSPRYLSTTASEAVGAKTGRAIATLVSVTVRGSAAIIRWRGNATTALYDLALRRTPAAWKHVRTDYAGTRYTVRGKKGQKYQVRVRGKDESGTPGPWSRARAFTLR